MLNHDLVRCIGSKLPESLKYTYARSKSSPDDGISELEKLSEFLYAEAELASKTIIFDPVEVYSKHENEKNMYAKKRNNNQIRNVYSINNKTEKKKNTRKFDKCAFCKANHEPSVCTSFARQSIEDRWETVKRHKVCFICLQAGHSKRDCTDDPQCCRRPHHVLLHFDKRAINNVNLNCDKNTTRCDLESGNEHGNDM